jgi:uncharacterized glyoxalase superfamily protein PhnB
VGEANPDFTMKLQTVVPMLTVPDVSSAVTFYQETLGFVCANELSGWASMNRDGVELMFALPNAHIPFKRPQLTGSLYFRCDDVDGVWHKVKNKAEVVYPIENFDYGMREFAIRDNNGYLLQFGQEIEAE